MKVTWSGDIWTMEPIAPSSSTSENRGQPSSISTEDGLPLTISSDWAVIRPFVTVAGEYWMTVEYESGAMSSHSPISKTQHLHISEWVANLKGVHVTPRVGLLLGWIATRVQDDVDPESYSIPLAPGSYSYLDIIGYSRIIPSSWTSIILMRGIGSDGYDVHVNGKYQAIVDREGFRQLIAWIGAQVDRGQAQWVDQEGGWKAERIIPSDPAPVSFEDAVQSNWTDLVLTSSKNGIACSFYYQLDPYIDFSNLTQSDYDRLHIRVNGLETRGVVRIRATREPPGFTVTRVDPSGQ